MDPDEGSLEMHLLHDYKTLQGKSLIISKLLLENLLSENIDAFRSIVEQELRKPKVIININHGYPHQSHKTCLDIACEKGLAVFVEFLVQKGADVNKINKAHNRAPIHFATENGHVDALRELLKEPTINPNLEAGQQTALHMAIKNKDFNIAKLLLEKGASPNIPDSKGRTALYMAAVKKQSDIVKLILQESRQPCDLDSYKDYREQTTRDLLQKNLPDIPLPSKDAVPQREKNVHDLKYFLSANDELNFLKCLEEVPAEDVNTAAEDFIEMAVQRNFPAVVKTLLSKIKGRTCNLEKAANFAIRQGQPDILRQLLYTGMDVENDLLRNACLELGIPGKKGSGNMSDRLECLKLILETDKADVRHADNTGRTPLHYAASAGCREAITLLLEKGSYIGHMNKFGIPPVADISASTLSDYLDNCLQTKKERTNEFTIEFNYRSLMPLEQSPYTQSRHNGKTDYDCREMGVFQYIARNSSLKHLLKHPLLSSFVYLKWHRIRHIFYLNFLLYFFFYLMVNTYILYNVRGDIGNCSSSKNTSETVNENSIKCASFEGSLLLIVTGISLFLFILRVVLQLISSPCHYMSSFENWVEMTLVILGLYLLNGAGAPVAAIVILLSAWELVILIGQHPRMSTAIEMFKTVSLNFMRFLFLYAFIILAFALAFFALFKDEGDEHFTNPGYSLFKTIIMLTGEFDANDIPFVSHPIWSHLIFVLFVFFIAIVLFNLLNGLAVSDTAEILETAELVGIISRIRLVSYVENMAIRRFVHGPHCMLCHGFGHSLPWNPFGFFVNRILLFPNYLGDGKLCVRPYDGLDAYGENKVFPAPNMDPHILKQARNVLLTRNKLSDVDKICKQLEKLKDRLDTMEVTLNTVKRAVENNNLNNSTEERGAN